MAGINKLLYGKKVEPETVMTAKQTMECMGVKDRHTFDQFIKEGMPHIIIGNRYYVPVNAFNKWIKEKTIIETV